MFCKCGALIFFPTLVSEPIQCRRCFSKIDPHPFTISISKDFLKEEEHVDIQVKGAKVDIPCPKCGKEEMMYNTAQLRSADEGQTVFYSCEGCGYKETVQS